MSFTSLITFYNISNFFDGKDKMNMKKGLEQLNLKQRVQIETLLKEKESLSEIAEEMNLSRQTIYREILRNSYTESKDTFIVRPSCIHFLECAKGNKKLQCPSNCVKYNPGRQKCLKKYPFVCNYCRKRGVCKHLHYYYEADRASNMYHTRLNEANAQPKTDERTIKEVNKIISPLVKKGQSVEAITMNHPEITKASLTIRNWIKNGYLDCKLSDFRMTGRRMPSKSYNYSKSHDYSVLSSKKIGHKYQDYLNYIDSHPNAIIIQLDTVIGCINGKCSVLTIHIVNYKFQFGVLLEKHSKDAVYKALNNILDKLYNYEQETGVATYTSFVEVILTDNGPEFDSLLDLCEANENMHVFYCHPLASFEKGSCERNHEFIRYIHYKKWSFDNYTQEDIDLLFSNINSYPRKSLNKKTPYQCVLTDSRFGKEFLDLINIKMVNCDDVTLNPSLLKKIKK